MEPIETKLNPWEGAVADAERNAFAAAPFGFWGEVEGGGKKGCKFARAPSHPLARELSRRASLEEGSGALLGVGFSGGYLNFKVNAQ